MRNCRDRVTLYFQWPRKGWPQPPMSILLRKGVRSKVLRADRREKHRDNQIKSRAIYAWENGMNLDSNQYHAIQLRIKAFSQKSAKTRPRERLKVQRGIQRSILSSITRFLYFLLNVVLFKELAVGCLLNPWEQDLQYFYVKLELRESNYIWRAFPTQRFFFVPLLGKTENLTSVGSDLGGHQEIRNKNNRVYAFEKAVLSSKS